MNGTEYDQECMVTVLNLGGVDEIIAAGCLPKSIPASSCDTRDKIDGKTNAICCCKDRSNCNNDAFINNCKAGTTPTSSPKVFTCIGKQSGSTSENDIECSSMCSGISIFGFILLF